MRKQEKSFREDSTNEESTMEAEQRRAAKEQMIALMQTGHRWQEAAAQAGIQVSRSTAYRLLRLVRTVGKLHFRMVGMGTPPNCERPSGHGWKATVVPRLALQAVWCRRPYKSGSASTSVSAI
jgi:transposase